MDLSLAFVVAHDAGSPRDRGQCREIPGRHRQAQLPVRIFAVRAGQVRLVGHIEQQFRLHRHQKRRGAGQEIVQRIDAGIGQQPVEGGDLLGAFLLLGGGFLPGNAGAGGDVGALPPAAPGRQVVGREAGDGAAVIGFGRAKGGSSRGGNADKRVKQGVGPGWSVRVQSRSRAFARGRRVIADCRP